MGDRNTSRVDPAGVLAAAIEANGLTLASITRATGIPERDLNAFLNGTGDITVEQLIDAGGVFSLSPTDLLGAAV